MNDRNDEIVDYFIAHVGNTTNSQNLEKYWLTYLLEFCKNNDIDINILTTDQHTRIRKFAREKYPSILLQFDVWHRAKKLTKVAMKKENVLLQPWVKSIVQHFWWSCGTCNKSASLLKEKWSSLMYHICGIHRWEDGIEYKQCAHEPLSNRGNFQKKATRKLLERTEPYAEKFSGRSYQANGWIKTWKRRN